MNDGAGEFILIMFSILLFFVALMPWFIGKATEFYRNAAIVLGVVLILFSLKGLKENVIMGRLIPAGTGVKRYRDVEMGIVET